MMLVPMSLQRWDLWSTQGSGKWGEKVHTEPQRIHWNKIEAGASFLVFLRLVFLRKREGKTVCQAISMALFSLPHLVYLGQGAWAVSEEDSVQPDMVSAERGTSKKKLLYIWGEAGTEWNPTADAFFKQSAVSGGSNLQACPQEDEI